MDELRIRTDGSCGEVRFLCRNSCFEKLVGTLVVEKKVLDLVKTWKEKFNFVSQTDCLEI